MSLLGLGDWRAQRGHEPAVIFEDEPALSWGELDALLNRSVNALVDRDLGPDRRVGVFAHNHPNTIVAYLTGVLAGCSGVPINYQLRAEECAYILRDSGARLLFVGPENIEAGLEAARLAGGLPVIAWGAEGRSDVETWEDFLASASPQEPPDDRRPRRYLFYTSGTTGFPKGTTGPLLSMMGDDQPTSAAQVRAIVDSTPEDLDAWLVMAPLYHGAHLTVIKRVVLVGRTLVLYRRFDAERTLRAIQEFGVTDTVMLPAHFMRLLALPEDVRARYDLSSLRRVVTGAAPCPVEVKHRLLEWFGPVVVENYGATEVGAMATILSDEWLEHPGSVGKVREGLRLFVVDEDGNELGPNEVGRLYFEDLDGAVDLEYYNDEEKTRSGHLRPGVWSLGDVGYIDDEGYLFLTDRVADMVNSGGVKIYPAEAEQVIGDLPSVKDVACIGVPHEDLGDVLRALVVPVDPDNPPSEQELIAQTQARLSKFKCPRSVEFVADLGRMPTGKLNRGDLRRRYERGEVPVLASREAAARAPSESLR
jgi:long-chain acyl-CoA synthetase